MWDGGGDSISWNDANNWDLNLGFPSAVADSASFTGTDPGTVNVNNSAYTVGSLNFTAGVYTLDSTGGGSLSLNTLTSTGGTLNLNATASVNTADLSSGAGVVNAATPLTITNQLKLPGATSYTNTIATISGGSPSFTISGNALQDNNAAHVLNVVSGTLKFAATPVLPTVSSSSLRLRLEADAGVISSAGSVSAWNDLSGNGFNASQVTPSLQPSIVASASPNGLYPAIRFDGVRPKGLGDSLINSTNNLQSGANGTTFFIVYKVQNNDSRRGIALLLWYTWYHGIAPRNVLCRRFTEHHEGGISRMGGRRFAE